MSIVLGLLFSLAATLVAIDGKPLLTRASAPGAAVVYGAWVLVVVALSLAAVVSVRGWP